MSFHRLAQPAYPGFPTLAAAPAGVSFNGTTYDFINVVTEGDGAGGSAFAEGYKLSGPNTGTYFHAFGEDATTANFNRGLFALAENCDFIDDLLNRAIALPVRTALATAGAPVSSIVLPIATFVGDDVSYPIAMLFNVVDDQDRAIISAGTRVVVDSITGATIGDEFSAGAVTLNLNTPIPTSTQYRVFYGTRSNLATLPQDAFTFDRTYGLYADIIPYAGSGNWADGNPLAATNVEQALDEIVSDLGGVTGGTRVGFQPSSTWATGSPLAAGAVSAALEEIVSSLGGAAGAGRMGFTPAYALGSSTVKEALDDLDYRLIKSALTTHAPNAGATSASLHEVIYAGNQFVASGAGPVIWTSPTGLVWTNQTHTSVGTPITGLAHDGTTYVAVGDDIQSSPDAVTWTGREVGGFRCVNFGGGLFVAAGGSNIETSPTGIAWTSRTPATGGDFFGAAYGNGVHVLVGDDLSGEALVETSADGITWVGRTLPDTLVELKCVHFFNGLFLAAGSRSKVFSSEDGITWLAVANPADYPVEGADIVRIRNIGNVWVLLTGDGRILTSKDGVNLELLPRIYPTTVFSADLTGIAANGDVVCMASHIGADGSTPIRLVNLGAPGPNNYLESGSDIPVQDVTISPAISVTRIIGISYALPEGTAADNSWFYTGGNALQSAVNNAAIEYGISHELNQGDIFTNFTVDVSVGTDSGVGNRINAKIVRRTLAGSSSDVSTEIEVAGTGNQTIDSGVLAFSAARVVDKSTYSYFILLHHSANTNTDYARSASITVTRSKLG